ncbi:MAG: isoprenoid biosynthesis glyoxalase ElbB [Prevotellaceae bacterium]|jgi:enhancing lycopene biosynthesis protein 2|nr:isoprenoid biosynthesis glyoxalase ElbB [Prevotellaceae bacterium]
MMKTKFAIVLSGCGVSDGSEIHEAIASILAVEKNGGSYHIYAPNTEQMHAINHVSGEEITPNRNMLEESARIARGDIKSLSQFNADDFDVLLFPGGFGAVKNLCNYATAGRNCKVNSDVAQAVKSMFKRKKIIAAICIAPVVLARILGNITVTLGNPDESLIADINSFGATHTVKNVTDVCIDAGNRIFTTPAYMSATNITEVFTGIDNLVKEILKFIAMEKL